MWLLLVAVCAFLGVIVLCSVSMESTDYIVSIHSVVDGI